MQYILAILYLYLIIYTVYFLVLAIRNLKDKAFYLEKKYSMYDDIKNNFAVVIYSHNNKDALFELINELKMQDYPLADFKVYAVLDNCNDGSDKMLENDRFVHVMNIQDVGTLGKTQAISMLLENLKQDKNIDAYVFIDGIRKIDSNFLTLANSAITNSDAVVGEVNINRENLDIVDKIKSVYKKYIANFFKQARTLCGLATVVDSGLFIAKKEVIDEFEEVKFNDINSELEFSLLLSKTGHKCIYNPNIQSYVYGLDCTFKNPRITKRFELIKNNFKDLKTTNFAYIEQVLSLLNPNFWLLALSYALLIWFSYNFNFVVNCNVVIFSAVILLCAFALSLMNAKMSKREIGLLLLYPLYSICHIIKNFPPIRATLKKILPESDKDADKLTVDVVVMTKHGDRPCKLEFISTEAGLARIRFIYKNKKYTTDAHLGMIYALRQLKSKMDDYGLKLKICGCCAKFTSEADGSTNMLKGLCHNEYPSPLLSKPQQTLIWNSCNYFEPAQAGSFIEQLAQEVAPAPENKKDKTQQK
ncbi:MAG: hypothetical protein SPL73_02885 [Cyanobacteriota bacterium]|nr:hypothetical protein [Cyanobacteriota bacterium]MDY6363815.1 hypothetical protein [Cyanobacteriota bacterium]MDY6383522.1 hypothetical protein [Cyanobacteriota bacterium]